MRTLSRTGPTRLIWIVTTALCAAGAARAPGAEPQADLYVAPGGNDRWSGTLAEPNEKKTDGPFASLERARDAVRRREKNGATVLIRGGVYRLKRRFDLGPQDSGTKDRPVVYAAYPGETPILDGGIPVTGQWQKRAEGNVWTLQLKRKVWFEDLYIDGKRQPRARTPNAGFHKARRIGNSKTQFGFAKGDLKAWPDAASGTVVIKPYQWCDFHLPIKSIDDAKNVVTLAVPCGYACVPKGYGAPGDYRVENVRAALDRPGEWCLDRKTGILSYWPPEGVDPTKAEIIAGGLPVMVSLTGNARKNQWVEHVVLRGLTFTRAGRHVRWRGYQGAALRLNHGVRNCSVLGCRFGDVNACGVVLWKECRENRIFGCEFVRTGDNAVKIFDYLGEGPGMSSGNQIVNNHIHHCNTVRQSICGIEMSGTGGNRVAHNLIHDMPYIGVRLSGTRFVHWSRKAVPSLEPPYTAAKIKPHVLSVRNVVEKNHIHHVMQELHDGGGIYFWGTMGVGPNIIRNNLIHHVGLGHKIAVGIYLDDSCDDVIVRNNIAYAAGFGLHLHGAPRNLVENNIFAYCTDTDISIAPEDYNIRPMHSIFRRNIIYMGSGKLYGTGWHAWDREPVKEVNHNLFWRGRKPVKLGEGKMKGFDKNSLVADPLFVDPINGDFGLKPDSPALKLGIQPISAKDVGPRPDPLNAFEIPTLAPERRKVALPKTWERPVITVIEVAHTTKRSRAQIAQICPMRWAPGRHKISGPPCEVWASYDDTSLLVWVTVPVKEPGRLSKTSRWGKDDGAEVCIRVGKTTYVLHGFPNGKHESVTEAGAPDKAAAALQRAIAFYTSVRDNSWYAAWLIPWKALGVEPKPGLTLPFNAGAWRSETREWIQWAGTKGATWRLDEAGILKLK